MIRRTFLLTFLIWFSVACSSPATPSSAPKSGESVTDLKIDLPLQSRSVRFGVIGDSGTGGSAQYEVAQQMRRYWEKVRFDFVIMLGDNIYGGHAAKDFARKFELPYKPLLDEGVKFYASLGNHDDPNEERLYKPFNMNGERYYTFTQGDVQFFVLDSNYMDPSQLSWLDQSLQSSKAKWKICYFHHPMFSNGKHHGPDVDLRAKLEPIFRRDGVNAVFSGHEHVYQRLKPQGGIYYFVLGSSGQLMKHDFHTTEDMESSYDRDQTFMLVEITGDALYYQVIARTGQTIDSGSVPRQAQAAAASAH